MNRNTIITTGLTVLLVTVGAVLGFTADDSAQLKQKIALLEGRINQLETQLADKQAANAVRAANMGNAAAVPDDYYDEWDPFAQMQLMQQQMNYLVRHGMAGGGMAMFNPKVDMKQTDSNYIVTMDIPGMQKDNINVEVKDGQLIVSGERSTESEQNKDNQYYRKERSFGHFMQAVPLPEDAKADKIEAKYDNGVLTITVGREKPQDKKAQIKKIIIK